MIRIGDFSKLSKISIKALRYLTAKSSLSIYISIILWYDIIIGKDGFCEVGGI